MAVMRERRRVEVRLAARARYNTQEGEVCAMLKEEMASRRGGKRALLRAHIRR